MAKNTTTEKPAASNKVEKGTTWLAEVIESKTGKSYSPYQLRILLRKLVKDGEIERGEGRWEFRGVTDPNVKAIIAAVKAGKMEQETKEKTKAAKEAAKKDEVKATTKRKPEPEPVVEDDENDEDLDDEIDEI